MALIDKASLLMVPSVYEDGTLYNVLPSGNKAPDETGNHNGYDQTRADFTFSRGFNLAATRVNANGLIEKGRENLLTYSNDFSQWSNSGTTETSGQADKDGGTDAWLLTKSTADGYIYQDVSQSGVQTYSVYLKANALNWARVQLNGSGADKYAYFDLANGVIGGSGSGNIDENIESVGNGWYRCSIVADTTSTRVRIYPADGDNDVSGTSGSIYIQDAQLESGLVSTPYIETGATTATAGVLENTPRIDYSSGAGALLLEPQRTNSTAQSEYIGASGVGALNVTNNTSETTSPEGLYNATLIAEDTTTGYHRIGISHGSMSNATKTFSVFAKWAGGSGRKWLTMDNGPICYFDLENGTKGNVGANCTADIEDYGNGWYRCHFTHTSSSSGTLYIGTANANGGAGNHLGNGEDAMYLYGVQAEDGASYPSSYVPTYGSAATRGAENGTESVNVIDVPTGYPFAIYAEPYLTDSLGNGAFAFYNNSNQYAYYGLQITSQGKFNILSRPQGVTQNEIASTSTFSEGFHKVVCLYESDSTIKLYVDGNLEATKSDCANNGFNSAFNDYVLGVFRSIETKPCSIKKFIVFNEGLTNQECLDITA